MGWIWTNAYSDFSSGGWNSNSLPCTQEPYNLTFAALSQLILYSSKTCTFCSNQSSLFTNYCTCHIHLRPCTSIHAKCCSPSPICKTLAPVIHIINLYHFLKQFIHEILLDNMAIIVPYISIVSIWKRCPLWAILWAQGLKSRSCSVDYKKGPPFSGQAPPLPGLTASRV